jgi:tetratricopeptide (TPR) repeat protein
MSKRFSLCGLACIILLCSLTGYVYPHSETDHPAKSNPDSSQLQTQFELGQRATQSGNLEEARKIFEELLRWSTQLDDKKYMSISLVNLGFIHLRIMEYSDAYARFVQAQKLAIGNEKFTEGLMSYADGMAKQKAGDHDSAVIALENARKIYEELGVVEGQIFAYTGLADSYFAKSDFKKTVAYYLAVLRKIKEQGSKGREVIEADTLFKMGRLHRLFSRYDEAIEDFRKAGVCFRVIGLLNEEATASIQIAEILKVPLKSTSDVSKCAGKNQLLNKTS